MDFFYVKNEVSLAQNFITMDNDSGYVSNNPESTSHSLLEVSDANNPIPMDKPIFISEDALLEKPDVPEASVILNSSTEDEVADYSHLYYMDVPESPEEKEEVLTSVSTIITPIKSIVITSDRLNSMVKSSCKSSSGKKRGIENQQVDYFSPDDKENDHNFLNILNNIPKQKDILDVGSKINFIENVSQDCSVNLKTMGVKEYQNSRVPTLDNCSANENVSGGCLRLFQDVAFNNRDVQIDDVPSSSFKTGKRSILNSKSVTNSTLDEGWFEDNFSQSTIGDIVVAKEDSANQVFGTPEKKIVSTVDPGLSPDLFADEETQVEHQMPIYFQSQVKQEDERYVHRNDKKLLRRVQDGLNGVLPPPSFTVVSLSVTEMLSRIQDGKEYFIDKDYVTVNRSSGDLDNSTNSVMSDIQTQDTTSGKFITECKKKSLLLTINRETCEGLKWPKILEERYHGLHYNYSKTSEEFELSCAKYAQRYVGGETQSTCTVFDKNTPSKRKSSKLRWAVKSPGRRLSHLAKRRITFSSASLQAGSSGMSAHARQILIDSKKMELLTRRKSPRKSPRKTPRKGGVSPRKKVRTPSSSVKKSKSLLFVEENHSGMKPSTSTNKVHATKRALFQSPDEKSGVGLSLIFPSTSNGSLKKRLTPKKALFLSPRKSPRKSPYKRNLFDNKRKRCDSGEDIHPNKLQKSLSIAPSSESQQPKLTRTNSSSSTSSQTVELSDLHKKKLQWAVYEALKSQKVTPTHPNFKIFASTLARVTRRFLPNLSNTATRPEGGTSERMLRIARQHVFSVMKGKTVDEIVQEANKARQKVVKPRGYIGLEQENSNTKESSSSVNKDNVLKDKSNILNSVDKKNLERNIVDNKKTNRFESRVDRVRKVINFGDDDNTGFR